MGRVCIVTRNTLVNDSRTIKEARILSKFGLWVTVIGLWAKNLPKRERITGFEIVRIPSAVYRISTSLIGKYRKITKLSPKPVRFFLQKADLVVVVLIRKLGGILNKFLTTLLLVFAAFRLPAVYYHVHFPLSLMLLVWLACILKRRYFIRDYNDIILLAKSKKAEGYYEQSSLWGKKLDKRELRRINDTITMIPKGTSTILDVGCGDGRITNRLASSYKVIGVDTSQAALKYVKTKTVIGSADNLPFRDQSFDLVLAAELLEHLPQAAYERTLKELKRVARKWILISVPWQEQLSLGLARCIRCKTIFHVNYHHRSFSLKKLKYLFEPDFKLVKILHTGGERRSFVRILLWIKQHLGGIWARTPTTVCPKCSIYLYPGGYPEQNAVSRLCNEWNKKLTKERQLERSHVIALYLRKTLMTEN